MINNCGTMGKLSVLPCLISHNHLKFLKHEAIKEGSEKIKLIFREISKKLGSKESKPKSDFKTLEEINPKLFDELIERNKSDYLSIIKEKLFPNIKRILEREVIDFICRRTLAFNKTREKILLDEFIHGTKSKSNKLITQPTLYKRTSIYKGIKLAKERNIIFTHQFKEGGSLWFFLNTFENQKILKGIEAGKISEADLYILNDEKVRELRYQKRQNKNLNDSNSEPPPFGNCTTPVQNLNEGYSDRPPQTIENTTTSQVSITTIDNNYKKNKQHNAAVLSKINFSSKENEYINKLCNLKTPEGININFNKNQAREIVKLNSDRCIFQIIDEKIALLFHEKNSSNSSWASILNNMIREDRGGSEAYINLCKSQESRTIHEKYMTLIQIFEPNARVNSLDRERAINIIKDRIASLYEISINNKNLELRDDLLTKIDKLSNSCNLKEDFGFQIDNPDSYFNQIIKDLKAL